MTKEKLQEAVDALVVAGGSKTIAARTLGIPRTTLCSRLERAAIQNINPGTNLTTQSETQRLKYELETKALKAKLNSVVKTNLTIESAFDIALGLSSYVPRPARWSVKKQPATRIIPTLQISDLHWGEVVDLPFNKYNSTIAARRLKTYLDRSLNLLFEDLNYGYDCLYIILGGDMISGEGHEDLAHSNELSPIQQVLDLFNNLITFIELASESFSQVIIQCVYGNHGRTTKKPFFKKADEFNLDWMLYKLLNNHFKERDDISFNIPSDFDLHYKIYNTAYVLTHGDRMGANGGLEAGVRRIRDQHRAMGRDVDYVVIGHIHEPRFIPGLISNGSTKGPDEFALGSRLNMCRASQNIWLTDPRHGITLWQALSVED